MGLPRNLTFIQVERSDDQGIRDLTAGTTTMAAVCRKYAAAAATTAASSAWQEAPHSSNDRHSSCSQDKIWVAILSQQGWTTLHGEAAEAGPTFFRVGRIIDG